MPASPRITGSRLLLSAGPTPLPDEVLHAASQKALMAPPGLGPMAVNARAAAAAVANPAPRFYWDWRLRDSPLADAD